MRLYVARHADAAPVPYIYGRTNPLTTTGRVQARAAGKALRGHGITHLYASSLPRAVETAALIGAALGLSPEHSDEWVEQVVPALEGLTPEQARAQWPSLMPDYAHASWWERDFGPGGETFAALWARARRVWDALCARHDGVADVPLLVTHGVFADFLLQAGLGIARPERHLFYLRPAAVCVVFREPGYPAAVEILAPGVISGDDPGP